MMNEEEIRHHQNNINNLINQLIIETNRLSLDEFMKNEQLKERVFAQMQELGQAAQEVLMANPDIDDASASFDKSIYEKLATLRNARYHQETERGLAEGLWNIIKYDLIEIEPHLEK